MAALIKSNFIRKRTTPRILFAQGVLLNTSGWGAWLHVTWDGVRSFLHHEEKRKKKLTSISQKKPFSPQPTSRWHMALTSISKRKENLHFHLKNTSQKKNIPAAANHWHSWVLTLSFLLNGFNSKYNILGSWFEWTNFILARIKMLVWESSKSLIPIGYQVHRLK